MLKIPGYKGNANQNYMKILSQRICVIRAHTDSVSSVNQKFVETLEKFVETLEATLGRKKARRRIKTLTP
jgi:hypothetical protein